MTQSNDAKSTGLLDEQVRKFLDKPRLAYLSTIDLKGYPHTVPVWFAVDGNELVFSATKSRTRVKHIRANPKGSVTLGGDPGEEGYMLQGDFSTEEDPNNTLRNKIIYRYLTGEAAERLINHAEQEARFIFRLTPVKVVKVR